MGYLGISRYHFRGISLGILSLFSLMLGYPEAARATCESQFITHAPLKKAFQQYFNKLKAQKWEGVEAFDRMSSPKIYMSPAFDNLKADAKRRVLSLLLLDYGEYTQLLPLLDKKELKSLSGSMFPYGVYTADGRVLSSAYNPCNRLITLTEYERSRLPFLGVNVKRIQRFPLAPDTQEDIEKRFWKTIGYDNAGDYWIEWVPEKGYFEIDVPSRNHNTLLKNFWQSVPRAYRYLIVDRGTPFYYYYQGKKTPIENNYDPFLDEAIFRPDS
jgi:hypothetical protein